MPDHLKKVKSNQQGYNLYLRRSVDMEYVVMAAGTFAGVLVYHILADIYKRCKRRKAEKEWRREARKFREHNIGAEEDE